MRGSRWASRKLCWHVLIVSDAPGTTLPMLPVALGSLILSSAVWSGSLIEPQPDRARPVPPALPAGPGEAVPEPPVVAAPVGVELPVDPAGEPPAAAVEPPGPAVVGPRPVMERERAPLVASDLPDSDWPDSGWVTVRAPRFRGTGMLVGSGLALGGALAFQAIDALVCGNCATGVTERVMLAASMGLAAGGGAARGRADAYDDTVLRRERPNTRRALLVGAALTGVGAALGLANEGMWWRCAVGGEGPYQVRFGGGSFDCRYGVTRGVLDLATVSTATGLAMLTWSLTYRRDARALRRARVIGLRPTMGRERWGLSLEGRF